MNELDRRAHADALGQPKYIEPERLIISSDCGMGREGMGRRHAGYKMVSMVLGTNIIKKELGLPETECLAANARYSLAP
jgi:5-methyltetrahydropteroyltriglutamate--homocysteine methyltransferase